MSLMGQGHCALRKGRHTLAGQVYLVTFATQGRQPLFADPIIAMAATVAIRDPRSWLRASLAAWVLMPDHWHGLVVADGEPLARTVQRLKCNTARAANLARGEGGRVWAPAFHDRALRKEERLVDMARDVVMNPVRAGLVARVADYAWWDAVWVDRDGAGRG